MESIALILLGNVIGVAIGLLILHALGIWRP